MSEAIYNYREDIIFDECCNLGGEKISYEEYIRRICLVSIRNEDDRFFINPKYRQTLTLMKLSPEYCADEEEIVSEMKVKIEMDWSIIKEILELEVERCNKLYSPMSKIGNLFSQILSNISSEDIETLLNKKTETQAEE